MAESDEVFEAVDRYIDQLFAPEDEALRAALKGAAAAGLPDIQITAGQGKLLCLLAKIAGARTILEIGTLGGYSTIWLARALPADGRLTTLEIDPTHAEVARRAIDGAGLGDRVELVLGPAAETLPRLLCDTDRPFDLVFIDADKEGYPEYLRLLLPALPTGALILADNIVRKGKVLAPAAQDSAARAAREFNAMVAADARLEAIILQQVGAKGHDGLAIARVK